VFTPHGKFSDQMLDRRYAGKWLWWRLWTKRHVRAADRLVLSSRNEARNLSRLGLSAEDAMIPNGYDAADPAYAAGLDAEPPVRNPYVLFLSYLDPRKQPELLVRAFARSSVSETHRLVIAGPDAYDHRSVIEETIADEQIGSRVTLYGPAYGEEKWALLSGATCFCLPSKGEGRPVTASEALGAGTPVVISRQSNFPEIAEEGAGIACDAFDVEAWSRALETVCHDEVRQGEMRRAAKRLAEDFTWSSVVDQWEEVYRDVITEKVTTGE
jgi:glycosyltransferase involved in cell wall biosynthesis